jgi:membrane dipeptidase
MTSRPVPIFDGHNDVLLRLYRKDDAAKAFMQGDGKGQLDFPRAKEGGFAGGMFAIFVPSPQRQRAPNEPAPPSDDARAAAGETVATPPPPDMNDALQATLKMASLLFAIERESEGKVRVCRTAEDIQACIDSGVLAPVLHIEGAEAIDENFNALDVLYQAGLRSIGPVWSRSNIFGHGVPFNFPSSPDTGPGLTDVGKELIRVCNRMKIMVDLSHLNEKGFWDVAAISDAPLVATHSNVHAICEHSRNLTDKQLAAIKDTDGMVGVNYAVTFLRPDGKREDDTPLSQVVDHIDYLIRQLGEDRVGLGSDFDGAAIPKQIGTAAGLPNLVAEMRARQYGEALIAKICFRNWLRVLKKTWS